MFSREGRGMFYRKHDLFGKCYRISKQPNYKLIKLCIGLVSALTGMSVLLGTANADSSASSNNTINTQNNYQTTQTAQVTSTSKQALSEKIVNSPSDQSRASSNNVDIQNEKVADNSAASTKNLDTTNKSENIRFNQDSLPIHPIEANTGQKLTDLKITAALGNPTQILSTQRNTKTNKSINTELSHWYSPTKVTKLNGNLINDKLLVKSYQNQHPDFKIEMPDYNSNGQTLAPGTTYATAIIIFDDGSIKIIIIPIIVKSEADYYQLGNANIYLFNGDVLPTKLAMVAMVRAYRNKIFSLKMPRSIWWNVRVRILNPTDNVDQGAGYYPDQSILFTFPDGSTYLAKDGILVLDLPTIDAHYELDEDTPLTQEFLAKHHYIDLSHTNSKDYGYANKIVISDPFTNDSRIVVVIYYNVPSGYSIESHRQGAYINLTRQSKGTSGLIGFASSKVKYGPDGELLWLKHYSQTSHLLKDEADFIYNPKGQLITIKTTEYQSNGVTIRSVDTYTLQKDGSYKNSAGKKFVSNEVDPSQMSIPNKEVLDHMNKSK